MAIALPDKRFSYIFSGVPGSCHDANVFQRSSLYQKLSQPECGGLFDSKNFHLIGDGGFPLKTWCLIPYKGNNLVRSQTRYNVKLSKTRSVIERAFGDLKNRFRRLMCIDASVKRCVLYTTAACCLHNICIENGDFLLTEYSNLFVESFDIDYEASFDQNGENKRLAIARTF